MTPFLTRSQEITTSVWKGDLMNEDKDVLYTKKKNRITIIGSSFYNDQFNIWSYLYFVYSAIHKIIHIKLNR